jgi:hypothetical protein
MLKYVRLIGLFVARLGLDHYFARRSDQVLLEHLQAHSAPSPYNIELFAGIEMFSKQWIASNQASTSSWRSKL